MIIGSDTHNLGSQAYVEIYCVDGFKIITFWFYKPTLLFKSYMVRV